MSSLPQGWHGIPVATKNCTSSTAPPMLTPLRKKWNSPMSSEVPRSRLPAYKSSNLRLQKSAVNGTIPTKSASKSPGSSSKNDISSTAKPSSVKLYQSEIAKFKKELAAVKTENSILKVKVRRVDDENIQKAKQIEKLRIELKDVQKFESNNSRKGKESELLLLRQKCLRLEGALKEKDLALNTFRKLNNEASLRDGICGNSTFTLESGDISEAKQEKTTETKNAGKSTLKSQSSLIRSSQFSKTEVAKLREIIHKMEKENQDLQLQLKDRCEEIRGLKLHLRNQSGFIKPPLVPAPKFSAKGVADAKSEMVPNPSSTKAQKFEKPSDKTKKPLKPIKVPEKQNKKNSSKPASSEVKKPITNDAPRAVPRKNYSMKQNGISNMKKQQSSDAKDKAEIVLQKNNKTVHSKLPVTKTEQTFVLSPPMLRNGTDKFVKVSVEEKAQRMRENIAAKKIQRGWRDHQKRSHPQIKDNQQNIQKALTFIVTSLKHHKLRKTKMNMLNKRRNSSPRVKLEDEHLIVEAIHATAKSMWEKDLSICN